MAPQDETSPMLHSGPKAQTMDSFAVNSLTTFLTDSLTKPSVYELRIT